MGTHACTRIQKDQDFIELHTRWDGFPDEIKKDLKNLVPHWQKSLSLIAVQLEKSNLNLVDLRVWVDLFKKFLDDYKDNPTLSSTAGLLCGQSFNHHHPLCTENEQTLDMLTYYGANNPNVVAVLEKSNLNFNLKKAIPSNLVSPTPVSSEYNIIRLRDFNDNGGHSFLDVKSKVLTHLQIQEVIFQLPNLWLELRHVLKGLPDIHKQEKFIQDLNMMAAKFYNPSQEYDRLKLGNRDLTIDDVSENVSAIIPFDFSSMALATHLFIASAGLIQPLTHAEQKWSLLQPGNKFLNIDIQPNNSRNSFIFLDNSNMNLSLEDHKIKINHLADSIKNRFNNLVTQIHPDFIFSKKPVWIMDDKERYGFNYEDTMIAVFDLLTQQEKEPAFQAQLNKILKLN